MAKTDKSNSDSPIRGEFEEAAFICYPKCSTCQKAQKWLDERGVKYTFRHIVEANPSADELAKWLKRSGLPISRLFNTSGLKYRALGLKDKVKIASQDELLAILATDGMLVKRPIFITSKGVCFGFKSEEWEKIC